MGTSSSGRGRRSRDVRRESGAAPSTIRLENPKIDPQRCRCLCFVADAGRSARSPQGAEIPSRGAAYRCGVVDPRPHSRKNSRNLAAGTWERPSSISRKGPLIRYFAWWRGQDLNLRPSGYENDPQRALESRAVPFRAAWLGLHAFDVPVRSTANQPISARGVEESVEVLPARRSRDQATWTASVSLVGTFPGTTRRGEVWSRAVATRARVSMRLRAPPPSSSREITDWRRRTRREAVGESTVNCPASGTRWRRRSCGSSSGRPVSPLDPTRTGPDRTHLAQFIRTQAKVRGPACCCPTAASTNGLPATTMGDIGKGRTIQRGTTCGGLINEYRSAA